MQKGNNDDYVENKKELDSLNNQIIKTIYLIIESFNICNLIQISY